MATDDETSNDDAAFVKNPAFRPVVTRFAPSPTGLLHLGHAYSAMLAFMAASNPDDRFLLRIEDIDRARCRLEFREGDSAGPRVARYPLERGSNPPIGTGGGLPRGDQPTVRSRCPLPLLL